ncbi:hypothetical protein ANAEL_04058 [Anaerolineales bacterium]|nr:hypothetical protein ANAEL_04058 [Anaerolineales bacterium]
MVRKTPIRLPRLYASAQQTYCQTQYGHRRSQIQCRNGPVARNARVCSQPSIALANPSFLESCILPTHTYLC